MSINSASFNIIVSRDSCHVTFALYALVRCSFFFARLSSNFDSTISRLHEKSTRRSFPARNARNYLQSLEEHCLYRTELYVRVAPRSIKRDILSSILDGGSLMQAKNTLPSDKYNFHVSRD